MNSILMGVDPSFSRTGVAVLDFHNKRIYFGRIGLKMHQDKTFKNVYFDSKDLVEGFETYLQKLLVPPQCVIMESPIPRGIWSGGLNMLCSQILDSIHRIPGVETIYAVSPTFLRRFHGHKYKKSDSVVLGNKLLEVFKGCHYKIISEKAKICHDEAEAFIYLCYMFVSFFDEEAEIVKKIIQICPGIATPSHKLQKIK